MRRNVRVVLCLGLTLIFFLTFAMGAGAASEAAVDSNTGLLEILLENKTITQTQYDALQAQSPKQDNKNELKGVWQNGVRFKSDDGAFDISIGGRLINDFAVIDADRELETAFGDTRLEGSGTEMRQARLCIKGTAYENFTFRAEYDFVGADADFNDVWIGMKHLPYLGEVRVGHQKEPLSMERLNSLLDTVFMERGNITAFVPGRNTGVKFHNKGLDNRVGWGIGAYKEVDDTGDGFKDESDYNITARITALPWYEEKGRRLLHLGLGYSHKFRDDATVRFRERPESHITDARLTDTGDIDDVDGVDIFNPEIALVYGPCSLQGEYVSAKVDSDEADDPDFSGFYVFGSFYLTGENRRYRFDEAGGEFTRAKINKDFALNGPGWGAWEVAFRYSKLDLNDKGIFGGKEENWTAALSWYINPTLRWSLNYLCGKVEDRLIDTTFIDHADTRILMTRFQISF